MASKFKVCFGVVFGKEGVGRAGEYSRENVLRCISVRGLRLMEESLLEYVEVGVIREGRLEVRVNDVWCVSKPRGGKFMYVVDSIKNASIGWENLGEEADKASEDVGPPSV